ECKKLAPRGGVPDLDRTVQRGSSQPIAVRAEGHASDAILVTLERPKLLEGNGVPNLDRAVPGSSNEVFTVGTLLSLGAKSSIIARAGKSSRISSARSG